MRAPAGAERRRAAPSAAAPARARAGPVGASRLSDVGRPAVSERKLFRLFERAAFFFDLADGERE